MHLISSVSVKNYKSIIDEEFLLSAYTPLVGYNNAGKSNILEAVKWLVKKSSLTNNCFNNEEEPVEVIGQIKGITEDIIGQLPDPQRNSISPFIIEEKLKIRRIQSTPGAKAAQINIDVWNDVEQEWAPNPNGIENAITKLFPEPIEIGAMEDAAEDVGKFKASTTIGKLIAEVMAPIEESNSAAIAAAFTELKNKFDADGDDRAEELTQFDQDTTEKLQELFPGIEIKLHIPAPEIKEVFKGGTLKVYEDGIGRELTSYGHGTQRSIQMALVRHLAEVQRTAQNSTSNTLLLIDEPELYLHPQAVEQVRSALKDLSKLGYQILFSTHSPQMIPSDDIKYTLLIRKSLDRGTYTRKRLKNAIDDVIENANTQFELLFSLENSNEILFSEKVLLTEGKTEKKLLPHLFAKHHGKSLGQEKLALIEQGGVASTPNAIKVLQAMDLPCKAIVDLDYAFRGAVTSGLIEATNASLVTCKAKFTENNDITLSAEGLPQKGDSLNAPQAFKWLGEQADMDEHIEALHQLLKSENIWLWKKGAIEEHLGLTAKNEQTWARFKQRIDDDEFGTVVTNADVIDMLNWIIE